MDVTMQALRKKMPSKRALTSTINQIVQQKSVAVLYTPTEVERIKQMTDLITQATNEFETDEDWDRILRVVEALSNVSNHAVLKESIWYLKLRLGDPSSRVVILALTLTESIVKNCGDLVHQEIATEQFMGEMEALYRTHANKRGRESMEIASRVLDMVQAWGEAFLPYRHDFPLFVDTYHNMRKKGIKFPDQYDESKVPVLTPSAESGGQSRVRSSRSTSSNQSRGSGAIDTSSYSNSSSGLGGLSTPELYRVATNVLEMFDDMLFEAQKDASSISSHGVMAELAAEVREIMHRLKGAIPIAVVEEDENLAKYLDINDNLHAALKKYDALPMINQKLDEESATKAKDNSAVDVDLINPFGLSNERKSGPIDCLSPHGSGDNQRSHDDDPFADFVRIRTGVKKATADKPMKKVSPEGRIVESSKTSQQKEEDPFASFVHQRASKIYSHSIDRDAGKAKPPATVTPVPPAKDLIDLWNDIPESASRPVVNTALKSDVWLDDDLRGKSNQQCEYTRSTALEPPNQSSWSDNDSNLKSSVLGGRPSMVNCASSSNDPFDVLDFSKKASISTSVSANPFDTNQATSTVAGKSFNPFDF